MKLRRTLCLLLAAVVLFTVPAAAAFPCISENACGQNYKFSSDPIRSYMIVGLDGKLVRADYANERDKDIFIEPLDDGYNSLTQPSILCELNRFCGIYVGKDAYYAVFAGVNEKQKSGTAVFRVVKYDSEWRETGHVSIKNVDTAEGCAVGNLRMAEKDGIPYVHTSRLSYSTEEKEGENGSFLFAVDTAVDESGSMTLKATSKGLTDAAHGYFSQSVDQYIGFDGDSLMTVDVTEAAPRGVQLSRYGKDPAYPYYIKGECKTLNVLPFFGETNDYTGASVGGFEITPTHYLIAGNSTPQNAANGLNTIRNIFVCVTDKSNFTSDGTVVRYVTDYAADSTTVVSTPHLVKINDSRYMLMWNENDTVLKYVELNGAGETVGTIKSCPFVLSDCKPIVYKNKLVWYSTLRCQPVYYELSLKKEGFVQIKHENVCSWLCSSNPFGDVPFWNGDKSKKHWAHEGIDFCVANGFMNGTAAAEFSPNKPMNRAMLVTVLWRMDGAPAIAEPVPFTDLRQNWYKQAVAWAYKNKIVNGVSASRFDPTGNITREQVASILFRYSAYKSYTATARADLSGFADTNDVHSYAKTAMSWACGSGLILGVSRDVNDDEDDALLFLVPRGSATRAQVATILMRFCSAL